MEPGLEGVCTFFLVLVFLIWFLNTADLFLRLRGSQQGSPEPSAPLRAHLQPFEETVHPAARPVQPPPWAGGEMRRGGDGGKDLKILSLQTGKTFGPRQGRHGLPRLVRVKEKPGDEPLKGWDP